MNDRAQVILDALNASSETTVKELARKLYISESTVRRGLVQLVHEDKITRTHRGAKLKSATESDKVSFLYRTQQNAQAKEQIARSALRYIHDNDLLMFDDSSTVMYLVPFLTQFKGLTVITNCIKTSYALCEFGIQNIMLGGTIDYLNSTACIGPYAEKMLQDYHGHTAFFSCLGISFSGALTSGSESQDMLRRTMMLNCKTRILLCDSTKLGKIYYHEFANVRDVDYVICNQPLPKSIADIIGANRNNRPINDQHRIKTH